jgi:hypothetical protein
VKTLRLDPARFTGFVCIVVVAITVAVASLSQPAAASDSPSPFYYGADSNGPGPTYSSGWGMEPNTGGIYGSYVGEVGTWTDSRGCTSSLALNTQYVTDVNANESWYAIASQDLPRPRDC